MIQTFFISDGAKWDDVVKSFLHWDVYYLSGYVRAFQIHGDGEPMLIYFENESTRGINVVMKRDVASDANFAGKIEKGKYFDFSTPYGYGGWLIEGDDVCALDAEYSAFCRQEGVVSEFVRFSPVVKNADQSRPFYDVVDFSKTIAIDTLDEPTIMSNFEARNRTAVRHAIKEGVVVSHGDSDKLYESFVGLYNATMARDNATPYYFFESAFYESIRHDLKDNATLFYAEYDSQIIAASIIMFANGHVHYHLSASNRDFQKLSPTNLLLYSVAVWAAQNGYQSFHLGGGVGGGEDNLYRFKSVFNKNSDCTFSLGKKIFDRDAYARLLALRGLDDADGGFFPKYREKV